MEFLVGTGIPAARAGAAWRRSGRRNIGGARDLKVALGGLLQDQLVQGQLRHRPLKPRVLSFQFLESLGLIELQPAVLAAPAVEGLLRLRQLAAYFAYRLAL